MMWELFGREYLDIDYDLRSSNNGLVSAITFNDHNKVVTLVVSGEELNVTNRHNNPLVIAIYRKCYSIVKLLLKHGANPDLLLDNSVYPIHFAAYYSNLKIVKLLVDYGARVNSRTAEDVYPLHLATHKEHIDMIDYFLKNGADIESLSRQGTPLHWAAKGSYDVVEHLVERGAKVNATDHRGRNPLHICSIRGMFFTMEFLIQNGIHIEVEDNNHETPLDVVLRVGHVHNEVESQKQFEESAKIIIKYLLLRNKNLHYKFSQYCKSYDIIHLKTFWNDCVKELEMMQRFSIGNTSISLFRFLQDLFDDKILLRYLYNRNLRNELKSIEKYVENLQIYSSVAIMIKDKVQRGCERKFTLDIALSKMDRLVPKLPLESKWKIFSYLSTRDLFNFITAFRKC